MVGSSRGFLLGPVYAGGAALPPPLPPLPLPGVLDPRRVVADNLCLLKETLLNRDVDGQLINPAEIVISQCSFGKC